MNRKLSILALLALAAMIVAGCRQQSGGPSPGNRSASQTPAASATDSAPSHAQSEQPAAAATQADSQKPEAARASEPSSDRPSSPSAETASAVGAGDSGQSATGVLRTLGSALLDAAAETAAQSGQ